MTSLIKQQIISCESLFIFIILLFKHLIENCWKVFNQNSFNLPIENLISQVDINSRRSLTQLIMKVVVVRIFLEFEAFSIIKEGTNFFWESRAQLVRINFLFHVCNLKFLHGWVPWQAAIFTQMNDHVCEWY